ncbi:uncharacterized protein [Amphiura filiformis]|uniref:uncharacterized protein n=1 Tax=Amphiura filiformis TaxID=82378 RepID=UPI003B21D1E1
MGRLLHSIILGVLLSSSQHAYYWVQVTGAQLSSPSASYTDRPTLTHPSLPDVDECLSNNCHTNALCTNTDGSFTCKCNTGYSGNGITCNDVDECSSGTDDCDTNAFCTNTDGSFTCTCNPGYSGNGITCNAECAENQYKCTDGQQCIPSHWRCDYFNDCGDNSDEAGCECDLITDFMCTVGGCINVEWVCDDYADCTDGSDEDLCGQTTESKPMEPSTTIAPDINECTNGEHNCHGNATCTNTMGSFSCACNSGYSGDGTACIDVNECTNGEHNCHDDATCTNAVGSFSCACNRGYSGDGTACIGM